MSPSETPRSAREEEIFPLLRSRLNQSQPSSLELVSERQIDEDMNDEDGTSHSDSDSEYVPRDRLYLNSSSIPSSSIQSSATSNQTSSFSNKRKRRYTYRTRVVRPRRVSKRHSQWMSMLTLTDDEIRSKICCVTLKCFCSVNLSRLRQSMTSIFSSSRKTRRSILSQLYTSSGFFFFDGKKVCSKFLIDAFRFSSELQTSVRLAFGIAKDGDNVTQSIQQVQNEDLFLFEDEADVNNEQSVVDRSVKRDAIVNFLNRIATSTANLMPDSNQRHLPFVNKVSVYERFKKEFSVVYPSVQCPSVCYFYSVWKNYCFEIKVRKSTRFTKCSTCERIREALVDATARNINTDSILEQQAEHLEFINNERLEYKSKVELAKLKPLEYMSIVVDGADQSAYALPHFIFSVKDERGLGMKVHLIGLLQHAHKSVLELYTMTDEHRKGSNHIIEVIHRFLNGKAKEGPLPRKLFIQMDNCSRENKNKFLMSYLDGLVRWGVFDQVEAGFLPVGHTHCDIDQAFSSTSNRLKTHNAITLEEMHEALRHCYNDKTVVMDLKQVANWSGLCDETDCCNEINHLTHYRFFQFCLSQSVSDSNNQHTPKDGLNNNNDGEHGGSNQSTFCRTTKVKVRHTSRDQWIPLETVNEGISTFLRFLPDLKQTPPEVIEAPNDYDKATARIESESQRIDSEEKLTSLFNLRDDIYRSRSVKFHWDLSEIVEMRATNLRREHNEVELEIAKMEAASAPQSSRLRYDVDSFVAVKGKTSSTQAELWIGRVVDKMKRGDGAISQLKVQWYEQYGEGDIISGKYRPLFLKNRSTNRKDVPWFDKITCDCVLNNFPTLTSQKRLPILVANDLRERIKTTPSQ